MLDCQHPLDFLACVRVYLCGVVYQLKVIVDYIVDAHMLTIAIMEFMVYKCCQGRH